MRSSNYGLLFGANYVVNKLIQQHQQNLICKCKTWFRAELGTGALAIWCGVRVSLKF